MERISQGSNLSENGLHIPWTLFIPPYEEGSFREQFGDPIPVAQFWLNHLKGRRRMESRHESSAPQFSNTISTAVFDKRVIDVGAIGKDHIKTLNYVGKLGGGGEI